MADHTGTRWSDLNWETEEVIDWIENLEPLNEGTEDITHEETMKEVVLSYLHNEPTFADFDWTEVDWDEVVNYRNEEEHASCTPKWCEEAHEPNSRCPKWED